MDRTSFGKEPKNNMKATEDFLELVITAHVITASKVLQKTLPNVHKCTDIAKALVSKFITMSVPDIDKILAELRSESSATTANLPDVNDPVTASSTLPEENNPVTASSSLPEENDTVYSYAVDFLTMGLLWYGFRDAVREGDAERIVQYWKFLMAVFRQTKHYHYSNEGFLLLAQSLLLSPREVCDLMWNRTVNTSGRVGKNIPVDLHMEHLNRRLKIMIRKLGPNISPATVLRASKALAVVDIVRLQFLKDDDSLPNVENKDFHTVPSMKKDLDMILHQLTEEKVFEITDKRQHKSYKDKPLLQSINWKNICKWCKDKIINYI